RNSSSHWGMVTPWVLRTQQTPANSHSLRRVVGLTARPHHRLSRRRHPPANHSSIFRWSVQTNQSCSVTVVSPGPDSRHSSARLPGPVGAVHEGAAHRPDYRPPTATSTLTVRRGRNHDGVGSSPAKEVRHDKGRDKGRPRPRGGRHGGGGQPRGEG